MHIRWIQKRSARLLVGLFLLPALAIRVLVPPGFMPGTGAGDAPTMQMCHGAGPLPTSSQSGPAGDGEAPDQRTHHEPPCVFAAAGTSAPPPVTPVVLGALQPPDIEPLAPEQVVVQRAVHRAQSARAPPFDSHPA